MNKRLISLLLITVIILTGCNYKSNSSSVTSKPSKEPYEEPTVQSSESASKEENS